MKKMIALIHKNVIRMFVRCTIYEIWISSFCHFGVDQSFCHVECEHLHNLPPNYLNLSKQIVVLRTVYVLKQLKLVRIVDIIIIFGWYSSKWNFLIYTWLLMAQLCSVNKPSLFTVNLCHPWNKICLLQNLAFRSYFWKKVNYN